MYVTVKSLLGAPKNRKFPNGNIDYWSWWRPSTKLVGVAYWPSFLCIRVGRVVKLPAFEIQSLWCHHHDKLSIVDLTITGNVGLSDHFVNLLGGEFLPKVGYHIGCCDVTIAVLVKRPEGPVANLLIFLLTTLCCVIFNQRMFTGNGFEKDN